MTDPLTASIIIILGKYALDKGATLLKEVGPQAAAKAGDMLKTALDYLRRDPKGAVVADEFTEDSQTYAKPLEKKLTEAIQRDPELEKLLRKLLAEYKSAAKTYAPTYQVALSGSGAIAHGDEATAAGERAVIVGGKVSGSINTGSQSNP